MTPWRGAREGQEDRRQLATGPWWRASLASGKCQVRRATGSWGGNQAQGLILGDPTPSHTTRLSLKRKAGERMGSRPRAQAAPRVLSPRAGPRGLRSRRHRGTRFTLTEAESALTASSEKFRQKGSEPDSLYSHEIFLFLFLCSCA